MPIELNDNKRQAIVSGATRMFLAHGFSQTSMEKIATAAPVSKATLYNYFDSKNTLLAEVILQLCRAFLEEMNNAVLEVGNIELSLKTIAQSFVDLIFTEEALGLYRLVIAESRDFPGLGELVYQSSVQYILPQLQDYLQQLNDSGQFKIADVEFAAHAFFNLLKGDRHFQCLLGIKPLPSVEEKQMLIHQAISFYLRGVLHAQA